MTDKQLEKKVSWLDKQRQKDAETLARLAERLEGSDVVMKGISQQIKELTSEMARVTALGSRIGDIEDAMSKHRQDVMRIVEKADTRRSRREKDREDALKGEREQLSKITIEMREGLRELRDRQKATEARREEDIRISRSVSEMEERMEGQVMFDEDKALAMASIEESRKHDTKRITDIQGDTSDLRERIELARGTIEDMDDRMARIETRINSVMAGENERRETQELLMDQQVSKMVDFEREWKTWAARFDEFEKRASEIDGRSLAYDETYRTLKQLQKDLSSALERLERRIHEISEMQRLAEDRSTQEWTTFQADEQKRWNSHKLTNDERWREHSRTHDKLADKVGTLRENVKDLMQGLGEMQENDRQRVLELLASLREWAAEYEARPGAKS